VIVYTTIFISWSFQIPDYFTCASRMKLNLIRHSCVIIV